METVEVTLDAKNKEYCVTFKNIEIVFNKSPDSDYSILWDYEVSLPDLDCDTDGAIAKKYCEITKQQYNDEVMENFGNQNFELDTDIVANIIDDMYSNDLKFQAWIDEYAERAYEDWCDLQRELWESREEDD